MNSLEKNNLNYPLTINTLIIENFYDNPMEVREFAINKMNEYEPHNHHPGKRSSSFASLEHKKIFEQILEPFSGKIINFDISKENENSNGAFQYNTSNDKKSWIHRDNYNNNNWTGIIYLTPEPPPNSGTGFYKYKDGTWDYNDSKFLDNDNELNKNCRDNTKWELLSKVGNVFNRLLLFRSSQYHMSMEYFGTDINDGRLIQLFFFKTEH
jgi:hypothetical protein